MPANTPQAVAWLIAWYAGGPYTIVHDREADGGAGTWRARQFPRGQEAALAAFIEANQGRNNLYFVPNLATLGVRSSPLEEDMRARLTVVADVDLPIVLNPKDPLVLDGMALPHERVVAEAALATLEGCEPPPSALVWSGGGYQAFWRLECALLAEYDAEVAPRIVALADAVGGDYVQNINRLMRLPGTVNVLNKKKRNEGRIPSISFVLFADWDRVYPLDVAPLPIPPSPAIDPLASLPPSWAERIRDGSTSHLKGKDKSRSAALWAVVCYLLRQHWSDAQILPILLNPDYGISTHVLDQGNPEAYARRQIADAKALLEKDFTRDERNRIDSDNLDNINKGLTALNTTLSYNSFSDKFYYMNGDARPKALDDASIIHYRFRFEKDLGFRPTKEYFRDALTETARRTSFHPIQDYLSPANLVWDRTPRLDTWAIEHGGAPDTLYARAVCSLIMIAAVARIYHPGIKFDQMLVLESQQQGTNKSQAIETLAVNPDWYTSSLELGDTEQKIMEQTAGKWFVEFSELGGMTKSEVEKVKSQMSRTVDSARPAYGYFRVDRSRQFVFWGTTNSSQYLRDDQNRRFWPLIVSEFDLTALRAVRDQLWAEARDRFFLARDRAAAAGVPIHESITLSRDLWPAAAAEQDARREHDPWEDIFDRAFLDLKGHIATGEAFQVIAKPDERLTEIDQRRVGKIMRLLGFQRVHTTYKASSPRIGYYYARGTPEERHTPLFVFRDVHTGHVIVTDNCVDPETIDPGDNLLGFSSPRVRH
jgi:predicted P-loop ATPase